MTYLGVWQRFITIFWILFENGFPFGIPISFTTVSLNPRVSDTVKSNKIRWPFPSEIRLQYSRLGDAISGKNLGLGTFPIMLTLPLIEPPLSKDMTLYFGRIESKSFFAKSLLRV